MQTFWREVTTFLDDPYSAFHRYCITAQKRLDEWSKLIPTPWKVRHGEHKILVWRLDKNVAYFVRVLPQRIQGIPFVLYRVEKKQDGTWVYTHCTDLLYESDVDLLDGFLQDLEES